MSKKIAVLLDESRMSAIKGSGLESQVDDMFGGALKAFTVDVPEEETKKIMATYDTARVDSRGFITDVPIAFNRALFEEIAKTKSLGKEALAGVIAREAEIKAMAAKESEYLPPPSF